MPRSTLLVLALALVGCEAPLVVDCTGTGRFARAGGDAWCLYPSTATRCPSLVPVAHPLPWGGRGCATRTHDPLPPELCEAAGRCADGGRT